MNSIVTMNVRLNIYFSCAVRAVFFSSELSRSGSEFDFFYSWIIAFLLNALGNTLGS